MVNLFDEVEVETLPATEETAAAATQAAPSAAIERESLTAESDVIVFDIETGPIDEDFIRELLPDFDPDSMGDPPGEFDESSVKLGNLKDQEKIRAKIEKAREDHNDAVTKWNAKASTARADYWRAVLEKAALSPITGQVLAIGYGDGDSVVIDDGSDDERKILKTFWEDFEATGARYCGWHIAGFDVWFLVNRSRILGIPHPEVLDRNGRYLNSCFIDLMEHWNCGARSVYDPFAGKSKSGAKAKDIAKVLGVARPADATPVVHGGQFAEFWRGTKEQREQAREYLRWDIREEVGIARAFGVL